MLKTIDAHAAGGPLRLIVSGCPTPHGDTMQEKAAWLEAHADQLRRLLLHEPRGHPDLLAAVLTEPAGDDAHAGVIFMDAHGYVPLSGHGLIGVATIAIERGLLVPQDADGPLRFDTPAGRVDVSARVVWSEGAVRVAMATVANPPSFVVQGGVMAKTAARHVPADFAIGGGVLYAIVDSEGAGLGLERRYVPELRRTGIAIARAIAAERKKMHPADETLNAIAGTVFTAAPHDERADLRVVSVSAAGRIDPSPGGSATSAVLAVLEAMGLAPDDRPFVTEGLAGLTLEARIVMRAGTEARDGLRCDVTGSAWITGEHTFVCSADDPLAMRR